MSEAKPVDWEAFNAPMKPGYYSGWSFEWPGMFSCWNVATKDLPNWFHRRMLSLFFGVRWTRVPDHTYTDDPPRADVKQPPQIIEALSDE